MVKLKQRRNQNATTVQVGDKQEFHRYEFKYLLDAKKREVIEKEISQFMYYDGHVDPLLGNMYFVRSLYFDDRFSTAFYEKIDGMVTRQKFRIRTYGKVYEEGMPIFVESKGRHNERTYKSRVAIGYDDVERFIYAPQTWSLLELYPGSQLIEHFVFDSHRRMIAPRVLVDYLRRPYICEFDLNFRVTFDSEICVSSTNLLYPGQDRSLWNKCRPGWTIMEIKFDRRIPKWFHRILQSYELRRLSISKFCLGMEACGIAEDLS